MGKILKDADIISTFTDDDYVLGVFGNEISRTSLEKLEERTY